MTQWSSQCNCSHQVKGEPESLPVSGGDELKQAQREEPGIKLILKWKSEGATKPPWPTVSLYSTYKNILDSMEQSCYQKWPSLSILGDFCRRWNYTTTSSPEATPKASFQAATWSTNSWAPWNKQNHWPDPTNILLMQLHKGCQKMVH